MEMKIGDKTVDNFQEFSYLDSTITRDRSLTLEMNQRLCKALIAIFKLKKRFFNNNDGRIGTKLAVYCAVVITTLHYNTET